MLFKHNFYEKISEDILYGSGSNEVDSDDVIFQKETFLV